MTLHDSRPGKLIIIGKILLVLAILFTITNVAGIVWLLLRNVGTVPVPLGDKILAMKEFILNGLMLDAVAFILSALSFGLARLINVRRANK